jgi:glutamate dehydrogenase (NAD(P)+)
MPTRGSPATDPAGSQEADATARGGIYVTREAAKAYGIRLEGQSMAIQGFGNAGQNAALLGEEVLGMKLVAASDSKGGVYNPSGLRARALVDYKLKNGTLAGFPDSETY